jgi:ribose transport system substrate-binding protein
MLSLRWFVCLTLLACVVGCGAGSSSAGKPAVAFVSNNPESFWSIAEAGARKAEKEEDVKLYFQKPDSSDAGLQKEKVDQVLNQGIKGVAISVIDPKTQNDYLKSVANQVSFFAVDNDAPESGRLAYIGTDNYAAGRTAGAMVKQAMPEGGTVVIFVGALESVNARQRRQGVIDELAGAKDAEIKDGATYGKYRYYKTYTDQPTGQARCNEQAVQCLNELNAEKNLCLVGLWAYNPPAMLTAVTSQGKTGQVKIVGFDEDPSTLEGIKKGQIFGTVVQQPYEFGYQSVKMMAKMAKGQSAGLTKSGMVLIPHFAITKDGADVKSDDGQTAKGKSAEAFHKELNSLLGK